MQALRLQELTARLEARGLLEDVDLDLDLDGLDGGKLLFTCRVLEGYCLHVGFWRVMMSLHGWRLEALCTSIWSWRAWMEVRLRCA